MNRPAAATLLARRGEVLLDAFRVVDVGYSAVTVATTPPGDGDHRAPGATIAMQYDGQTTAGPRPRPAGRPRR